MTFASTASNLVPGDTNGLLDVFIHDRDTDGNGIFDEPGSVRTSRLSLDANGNQGNGSSFVPRASVDGRSIAFTSAATNLSQPDTNNTLDVFVAEGPARCSDGTVTDTDGDGLLDCWEKNGIDFDGDGQPDFVLNAADANHKDVYLEIDFMAMHRPNAQAISDVIAAYAAAPVNNPDGTRGISLHVEVDEQVVAHSDDLAFVPCTTPAAAGTPDFDAVKQASFGNPTERGDPSSLNLLAAKRLGFHYVLFAHNLQGLGLTSGCAELPGNDLVVSLGAYQRMDGTLSVNPADGPHFTSSRDSDAGTLMHELGHNLNLQHGGGGQYKLQT